MKLRKLADDYDWETLDAEVPGHTNSYVVDRDKRQIKAVTMSPEDDEHRTSLFCARIDDHRVQMARRDSTENETVVDASTREHINDRFEKTLHWQLQSAAGSSVVIPTHGAILQVDREFKEDNHVFARCYNELDEWSKAQIVDWADCSTWFVLKQAWY
ncbi:hypothetical protein T08_3502 [Trichinella sp. T8]|nr:hypothetical protein T08_3502 [Trichinella sp. T8]